MYAVKNLFVESHVVVIPRAYKIAQALDALWNVLVRKHLLSWTNWGSILTCRNLRWTKSLRTDRALTQNRSDIHIESTLCIEPSHIAPGLAPLRRCLSSAYQTWESTSPIWWIKEMILIQLTERCLNLIQKHDSLLKSSPILKIDVNLIFYELYFQL